MADLNLHQQLIDDITQLIAFIDPLSRVKDSYEPPGIVVAYLRANQELIELCLDLAYERTTEDQRLECCKTNKGLEPVAAKYDFKGIAAMALGIAENYWYGFNTSSLNSDSLNMRRRGLAYAKCARIERYPTPFQVVEVPLLHPISKYLKKDKE